MRTSGRSRPRRWLSPVLAAVLTSGLVVGLSSAAQALPQATYDQAPTVGKATTFTPGGRPTDPNANVLAAKVYTYSKASDCGRFEITETSGNTKTFAATDKYVQYFYAWNYSNGNGSGDSTGSSACLAVNPGTLDQSKVTTGLLYTPNQATGNQFPSIKYDGKTVSFASISNVKWFIDNEPYPNSISTITLPDDSAGKKLKYTATIAVDGYNPAAVTSGETTIEAPPNFSDFTPVITGSGKPNETLTATAPTGVTPTPASYEYKWQVDDQRSPVSTTDEYTPTLGDQGKQVTLTVTAKGANGQPADKSATATKDISTGPGFTGDVKVGSTISFPARDDQSILLFKEAGCTEEPATLILPQDADSFVLDEAFAPGAYAGLYVRLKQGSAIGTCAGPIANGTFDDLSSAAFTGTAKVGETVEATEPTGAPSGTTFDYAWTVGETTVSTDQSYTVEAAYAGQDLQLTITAKHDGFDDRSVSTEPTTIAKGTLADPGLVVSDSTPETAPTTGDTLSLGAPEIAVLAANPEDTTTTWAWGHRDQEVVNRGGKCLTDGVYGTDAYTVTNADAGQLICARILTQAEGYENLYTSADAADVAVGTFTAPIVTFDQAPQVGVESKPVVTGLDPEGTPSYSWKVDGTEVSTNEGYEPTPADLGKKITVTVTNTKDHFIDDVSTSDEATVKKGVFTIRPVRITGTPKVGQTLTHTTLRTPRKPANVTYTYQWGVQLAGESDCLAIGATATTLVLPRTSKGSRICVITTATAPGYKNAVSVSDLTDVVDGLDLTVWRPTISDTTPEIGDTLYANVSREGYPQDARVEYLWGSRFTDEDDVTSCSPFHIDPSSSYTVKLADAGTALCVVARVSAEGYNTGQASSRFTSKVAKRSLGTVTVVVPDSATVGETIYPSVSVSGTSGYGFTTQWGVLRQASGGSPSDGPVGSGGPAPAVCQTGGISSSYFLTVPASLVGERLCAEVHVVAEGYEDATVTSNFTEPVAAGTLDLGTPVISDTTPTFEDVLTATVSGAPEGASTSWAWGTFNTLSESCDVASVITQAKQLEGELDPSSHTVTADEVGQRLCVVATVTADGYEQASATSDATETVAAKSFTGGVAAFDGTPTVDVEAVAPVSGLDPEPTGATFLWTVDGTEVSTDEFYTPVPADAGKEIVQTTTSTRPGYADSVLSATATVDHGQFSVPRPTIDDTSPEVGQTLSASIDLSDAPEGAVVTSYQWGVLADDNCAGIPGADQASYRVTADQLGDNVCVMVTASAPGYYTAGSPSFGTDEVAVGSFEAPQVTIDDTTPVVGQTLTADVDLSELDLVSTPSVSYRWGTYAGAVQRGLPCQLFEDEPSATYTVTAADVTAHLCVVATVTADGYAAVSSTAISDAVGQGTTVVGQPTIVGTPKVGKALTATGPVVPSGGTAAYYWGTAAVGSTKCITSSTATVSFTPKATDLGRTVCVVAKVTGMTAYEDATSAPTFSTRVRETAAVTLNDYTIKKGQKFTISATDLTPGQKYSIEVYDTKLTGTAGANGRISREYTYPTAAESKTRKITVAQVSGKTTTYRKAVYLTYTK